MILVRFVNFPFIPPPRFFMVSHSVFAISAGSTRDPGAVEEHLCVGHAAADDHGRVHVQRRRPRRTNGDTATARDRRYRRAAGRRPVQDGGDDVVFVIVVVAAAATAASPVVVVIPAAYGHGRHTINQLSGRGRGAHRRYHRPVAGHHAAPFHR